MNFIQESWKTAENNINIEKGTTFIDRDGVIWLCTNDDPDNQEWERIGRQISVGEKWNE